MNRVATRQAERAYTIREAAELMSVSQDTIRRAIAATEGPHIEAKKLGNRIRIAASALDAWFDSLDDA